jgi:outer membrane lipoprotein-sorting protein
MKIMHCKAKRILWSSLILVFLLAGTALAAEFSADMVITSKMGQGDLTGRAFVKGNALRQELDTPIGVQTTIIPSGAAVMYVLLPGQKKYMEIPNTQVTLDSSEDLEAKMANQGKVTKKGSETIEGYSCDVYSIVYNDKKLGEGTIWVSSKLNYPLKIYTQNPQDTATIMYRNIREGKLDEGMFSIPPGYTKFSM